MNMNLDELSRQLSLSEEKKAFMKSFTEEAKNFKDKNEGMTFMKKKIKEAKEAGITFSNADILMLANQIKQSASPKEQMLIQKILEQYNIKQ